MMRPRKPKVLIFDDDAQIRGMVEKYFALKGYDALSFNEPTSCSIYGDSADNCRNLYPCADILITDCQMPRLDGLGLVARIREHEQMRDLPILMLTAKGYELSSETLAEKWDVIDVIANLNH